MIYLKNANLDRSEELLQYAFYEELFNENPNNGFAFLGTLDIKSAKKCFLELDTDEERGQSNWRELLIRQHEID